MNDFTLNFNKLSDLPNPAGKSVCLIIPPSPFLLDERVFVSLGVLRVAAALESQGVDVKVLDLSGVENFINVLDIYFSAQKDEWVGITATTPQLPFAFKIAAKIRTLQPELKLVLGGPHVTLTHSALKMEIKTGVSEYGRGRKAFSVLEEMFDVLVSGDGEYAVFRLFDPNCPKVVDADDNKGPMFMTNSQYDDSPWPARHLVDMNSYKYSIEGFPATSLIAQLGCPFHCGFCGGRNSKSLRLIRTRSIDSIIREMEWLYHNYGFTGFMFYDDELNVNKSLVELMNQIVLLQKKLGVEFRLRGFIKAELFTEAQALAMYQAGFRWLLCGFESANPRILKNIEKCATLDDNTRAVEIAKKYNLKVKALMSIGHPGESEASINDIKEWLIRMDVEDFDCTIITTYPGTPYYDSAKPNKEQPGVWTYTQPSTGDRLHAYELDYTQTPDYYKGDPDGGYKAYVFTDYLNSDEIVRLRDALEQDVRKSLNLHFNLARPSIRYEHSMGQGLPSSIYRESQYGRK